MELDYALANNLINLCLAYFSIKLIFTIYNSINIIVSILTMIFKFIKKIRSMDILTYLSEVKPHEELNKKPISEYRPFSIYERTPNGIIRHNDVQKPVSKFEFTAGPSNEVNIDLNK